MKRKNQIILILFVCSFVSLNIYNVEAHQISSVLYNQIFIPSDKVEYVSKDWIYKLKPHNCRLQGLTPYSWFSLSNSTGSRLHKGIQILFDSVPREIIAGVRNTKSGTLFTNEHLWSVYYEQAVDFAGTSRYYQLTIDFLYSGYVTNTADFHTFNLTKIRVWLYETYYGHVYTFNEIDITPETNLVSLEWNMNTWIDPSGYMAMQSILRNKSIVISENSYKYLFSAGGVYLTATSIQGRANFRTGLAGISYFNTYFTLSNVYIRTFYSTISDRTTTPLAPPPISNSDFRNPALPDSIQNTINWTYKVFSLTTDTVENISYSREYEVFNESLNNTEIRSYNFSTEFQKLKINETTSVFTITKNVIQYESWGNWEIKWFVGTAMESSVNFNWLRNAFVNILNFMLLVLQIVLFLAVSSLQYLLLIFLYIAIIIWNFPIFWIFVGVIGIVFYLSFFFVWLWNQIVVLWKLIIEPMILWLINWIVSNVWNPLVEFFRNGGLKILFDFYMIILSYIIAFLLWILTFGTQDFSTIQQAIQSVLLSINAAIFEFLSVFFENFIWIMLSAMTYVLLIGLIYIKYIYAKSRGYVQRAARLQAMINVYKIPMVLSIRLINYIIGFLQGGVPTDGLNE